MQMLERYTQPAIGEHPRRFNVAPGQQAVVLVEGAPRLLRWGLLAPWKGHGGQRPPPIRIARRDAVMQTPVLARARRCLVAGDGWYARSKIRAIHAWWLHGARAFAGVWTTNVDDGVPSFAIIGEPSTSRAAWLPSGADERWVTDGTTLDVAWREREVSRYFEDVTHDDARCIEPLDNPNQGTLF